MAFGEVELVNAEWQTFCALVFHNHALQESLEAATFYFTENRVLAPLMAL
jgi:hypothetical protein